MTSPFVQEGSVSGSPSASSLTPAMPAGRTTGNLLVVFVGMPRGSRTFSYSSGWTEFDHISGTDHSGSLAYRYVDGTETNPAITITGGSGPVAARVFEFTGVLSSSPIGATHHTETFSFGGAVTDAGFTSTAANSYAVVFCEGSSGTVTLSTPSGYTLEGSVNGSSGGTIGSWDQTLGASGSASTSVSTTPSSSGAYGVYSVELLTPVATQTLTLTGIASGNAFGGPTFVPGAVTLALTGIASGNAFGVPAFGAIGLTGFANANAFGAPVFAPGPVPFDLTGIAASNQFGSTAIVQVMQLTSIAASNQFGAPALAPVVRLTGIANGNAFGVPVFAPGPASIHLTGLAAINHFGAPALAPGAVLFALTGIANANAFGVPRIAAGIRLAGVAAGNLFGAPAFAPGPVSIHLTGLAAANRFGAEFIDQRRDNWFFKFVGADETVFGPQHMVGDDLSGAKGGCVILSFKRGWTEAQIATLELKIINPGVSVLSIGRERWGWCSYRNELGAIEPLFFGRLTAIPSGTTGPTITLQFLAQPRDYLERKRAVAVGLQHLPEYDEALIDVARRLDPDATLEGYSAVWHVDPVTHQVTISDVVNGEDGTEIFTEDDVIANSINPRQEQPPLRSVLIDCSLRWQQILIGEVEWCSGKVFTTTGADGLVSNWPKPLQDLGGGWSVKYSSAVDTFAATFGRIESWSFNFTNHAERHANGDVMTMSETWTGPVGKTPTNVGGVHLTEGGSRVIGDPDTGRPASASVQFTGAVAYVGNVVADLVLSYDGRRERTETVRIALAADVQDVVTDSGNAAADFAQDSELITLDGRVGAEGPFGEFRGEWAPGVFYFKYDIFTRDNGLHAYTVTRDHLSLPAFDQLATAGVWQAGARLGAGENVFSAGRYYQVLQSHVARDSFDPRAYDFITHRVLYGLIEDPHSGPRLYSPLSGFRGDWRAGQAYLAGDVFVEPVTGRYVQTQIAHETGATYDLYAANVDGRLLYAPLLNPAPIGDKAAPSYITTARGLLTAQHLMLRARARLRYRSRAVAVPFDCISFDRAVALTLRKNATVHDAQRLGFAGGEATGKITEINLTGDGNTGIFRGSVKIMSAVGTGGTVDEDPGEPTIWDDSVIDGCQARTGNVVLGPTGDFAYEVPTDAPIDDGLRAPLTRSQVALSESFNQIYDPGAIEAQLVSDGILDTSNGSDTSAQQRAALRATQLMANAGLLGFATWYTFTLAPVQTGPYSALYEIATSRLQIDKQIDLAA